MSSWPSFRRICLLHTCVNALTGALMVLSVNTLSRWIHGPEVTDRMHLADKEEKSQLIQTSESLVGMMLIIVAILLHMVSYLQKVAFQR